MSSIHGNTLAGDVNAQENRRCEGRRRVLQGGRLRFNGGYGAMECVVRNRSEHGARLSFGDTAGVPPSFELFIADRNEPFFAHVCWRSPTQVGVRFA